MTAFILITTVMAATSDENAPVSPVKLMQKGRYKEALAIFEKMSENGDDKAMVDCGIIYYEGLGVKQDYSKAMDWFLKALEKNNPDAFSNLGVMHRDGQNVPKNKKIAYCIFLTIHMCGLGSESTQMRSNSCLRRLVSELSKDEIKDCLSNYTQEYVFEYVKAKGKMVGIPDKYKPSKENPAFKDLDWWMEGELDGLYGEPTEEEKKARKERSIKRQKEFDDMVHTLIFQVKFTGDSGENYKSYEFVTDSSIGSHGMIEKNFSTDRGSMIYEDSASLFVNNHRFLVIEGKDGRNLAYEIKHPSKPSPSDWSNWLKPIYSIKDKGGSFELMNGNISDNNARDIPPNSPEVRFKVIKE